MRFGARVSKTPCQTLYPWVSVLARCFAYACTKSHQNRSKFGGDIAQINAHRFLLSPINFIINSTSQRPWEQKGQKTRVTPYAWPNKNAGSRDSRITSANSTPTSRASSALLKMCRLDSTSTALPHPVRPPHHDPSSSHSASTNRPPRKPHLPRPERSHNPTLERQLY